MGDVRWNRPFPSDAQFQTSRSHPLQIFLGSIDPCGKTQTNPPEMCLIYEMFTCES